MSVRFSKLVMQVVNEVVAVGNLRLQAEDAGAKASAQVGGRGDVASPTQAVRVASGEIGD